MPGVAVTLRGTTLAATTDPSGRYLLGGVPVGEHVVIFSKAGFARATVTEVRVVGGQTSTVDVRLRPEFYEMEAYEVTAEGLEQQAEVLLLERQSASALTEALGSEQFSRLGAGDAAEITAKVAGTTIVEGKFAVIRGLSDRYTGATLNGAEIPSADPYRESAQLDLFPSGQIDRVTVSKTFTPDQPGSFTGGNINIVTKSFPEHPFVRFSLGTEYNTQASLNDAFLVAPEASADVISSGRDLPQVPSSLQDPDTLQPGGFGDPVYTPQRNAPRNETTESAAHRRAQADQLERYNRQLGTTGFEPRTDTAPLNTDFGVEGGTSFTNLLGIPMGTFASFNYERDFDFYDDGIANRYTASLGPKRLMDETRSRMLTQYGGNFNLAAGFSPEHTIRFNFLINKSVEDEAREQTGYDYFGGSEQPLLLYQLHYTDRQIQAYQLSGQHEFPSLADHRLEWLASYAIAAQDEPNFRFFYANVSPEGRYELGGASLPQPNLPSRFYRDLEENSFTARLDDAQPFTWLRGLTGEAKAGFYLSHSKRTVTERTFSYRGDTPDASLYAGSINDYLNEENLGYMATRVPTANPTGVRTNYSFPRFVTSDFGNNDSDGTLEIYAGYLMVDAQVTPWARLIGGARYETTLYDVSGKSRDATAVTNAFIDEGHLLPVISPVFAVRSNMNLRLSYARTIARPSFREITPGNSYDPTTDDLFIGNPNLQISQIDNYDLRWEWYRRPAELFSVSLFYKDISQPIERTIQDLNADKSFYANREEAILYGIELEARTELDWIDGQLADFSLGANAAFIRSEVELTPEELFNKQELDPGVDDTRPLYDQSPYVVNLDLTWDNDRSGTTATLAANLTGARLFLANPVGPDIYEHPPPGLDFILSQRLGQHWKIKFSARNLLNPEFRRTYDSDPDGLIYSEFRRGIRFGLSVSAEF
jgi:outer membrane receptor protein involved in Fe transport